MNFDNLSKEQQIMVSMRHVLTNIIRELTVPPGKPYPLSKETVEDIRLCLTLISGREQELAKEQGTEISERPYYTDDPQNVKTVPVDQIKVRRKSD